MSRQLPTAWAAIDLEILVLARNIPALLTGLNPAARHHQPERLSPALPVKSNGQEKIYMSQQMQNKPRKPRAKGRRWTIADHMRVQTKWRYKVAGVRYDDTNGGRWFDLETGAQLSGEEANKRRVEYWRRHSGRELTFDQLLDRMLKFY